MCRQCLRWMARGTAEMEKKQQSENPRGAHAMTSRHAAVRRHLQANTRWRNRLCHLFTSLVSWWRNRLCHLFTSLVSWWRNRLCHLFTSLVSRWRNRLCHSFTSLVSWWRNRLCHLFTSLVSWWRNRRCVIRSFHSCHGAVCLFSSSSNRTEPCFSVVFVMLDVVHW